MTAPAPALLIHVSHTGTRTIENYAIEKTVALPSYRRPLYPAAPDTLGDYRFLLHDAAGRLVASEGYAPLFKEWQSTLKADDTTSTASFEESFFIPDIAGSILTLERRHPLRGFEPLTSFPINQLTRTEPIPHAEDQTVPVQINGNPATHMDFVILAEGYTIADRQNFVDDLNRLKAVLMSTEPYASASDKINITGLFRPTAQAGVAATPDKEASTPRSNFGTSHGVFDMARYMMPLGHHALAEAAAPFSPDVIIVLVNTDVFGGGAMYGQHACIAARQPDDIFSYIVRHELGHVVAGLADEYYSNSTYDPAWFQQNPPWQPNASLLDANGHVKWQPRIAATTPTPTPWDQAGFDALNTPADPKTRDLTKIGNALMAEPFSGVIGAFEGACYSPKWVYRPAVNCIMFSRTTKAFCPICTDTLNQAIQRHTINKASPRTP